MIGDTIFAVASPPGAAERGILRLSGPDTFPAVNALLDAGVPRERGAWECSLALFGFPVDVLVLGMPGPRSFTGEDVVELHLPGSPLLLARVQDRLRGPARDATPGEFTRRAFENGRLDLASAEAVGDLIHAASDEQRRFALDVLSGGIGASVDRCRAEVQDALAMVEAGLDFEAGDTGEVDDAVWLAGLARARAALEALSVSVPRARLVGDVLVLGAANAGKSSLCNALAGRDEILVADRAGTTRDVLAVEVGSDGITLLDSPGDLVDPGAVDRAALDLRDRLAGRAAAALLVVDGTHPQVPSTALPVLGVVVTKRDLVPSEPLPEGLPDDATAFRVSCVDGRGVAELREYLLRSVGGGPCGGAARIAESVASSAEALERAIAAGEAGEPPEVVACDVQDALAALDAVHGRSSPEDLLDRIFGRFCLGK